MAPRKKLSQQEEKFATLVIAGESYIDAYNQCYKVKGSPSKSNRTKDAKMVADRPIVAARIKEGQKKVADKATITAESLIVELEEARQLAKSELQPSAMVGATMGKAKLAGLDKVVVELQAAEELTAWSVIKAGVDKKDGT